MIQFPTVISMITRLEPATQICSFSSSCLLDISPRLFFFYFFRLFKFDMPKVLLVLFSTFCSTLLPDSLVASPSVLSTQARNLSPILDSLSCLLPYPTNLRYSTFNYLFSTCFSFSTGILIIKAINMSSSNYQISLLPDFP